MDTTNPERPRAEEYAALHSEVLSLHKRCLAILGGTVALSAVAIWGWLELVQTSQTHGHLLALVLAYIVVAAMAVTYKFYERGLQVASYLEVFHEPDTLGWQSRSRQIPEFIRRRKTAQRRSVANLLEPRVIAYVYLPLVAVAALLILASPITNVRLWRLAPAAFALGLGTYLFLELGFFFEQRHEWWRWWWSEYRRLESTEPGKSLPTPPCIEGQHDPVTSVVGLLFLEVAVLFLLGLTL
jgi:hypothetical protein